VVGVVQSTGCDGQSVQVFRHAAGKQCESSSLSQSQQQCAVSHGGQCAGAAVARVYPARLTAAPAGSSTCPPLQYRAGTSVNSVLSAFRSSSTAATAAANPTVTESAPAPAAFYFQDGTAGYRTTPAMTPGYYEKCAI